MAAAPLPREREAQRRGTSTAMDAARTRLTPKRTPRRTGGTNVAKPNGKPMHLRTETAAEARRTLGGANQKMRKTARMLQCFSGFFLALCVSGASCRNPPRRLAGTRISLGLCHRGADGRTCSAVVWRRGFLASRVETRLAASQVLGFP